MTSRRISIITAAYAPLADYFTETIESVVSQELPRGWDLEWLVQEDGETPGLQAPQSADVERVLTFGRDLLAEPRPTAHLLVHCHAGISRSTASMVLIIELA